MKKFWMLFLVFVTIGNAQEDGLEVDCSWEIYVGLKNSWSDTYSVSATNVGNYMWNGSYILTESFSGSAFSVNYDDVFSYPSVSWPYGFDFVTSINEQGNACTRGNGPRHLTYGLFRIDFINEPPTANSIYLDLRDDRYPLRADYMPADVWIKYDDEDQVFEAYFNNTGWVQYDKNDTIRVWDFVNPYTQSHYKFQPTAPTNLSATPYNGNPNLTWSASALYVTGYHVYRNTGSGYQQIGSTSGTSYIDYDVAWSGNNENNT